VIVSHAHRFIFLKTRKTAGTSIEVALSRIAGPDAIVTPLHPPEPGHAPRNYGADGDAGAGPCLPHMRAAALRGRLGPEVWGGYFKFCFERNPWDKVASIYWWRNRRLEDPPPFEEWVLSEPRVSSDWPIYSIGSERAVDAVGRYESLSRDLGELLGRAGVKIDGTGLPRAKSGFRRQERIYTPTAVEHVHSVFSREIEAFGYDCPEALLART
jgi:hypothetical protein